MAKQTKQQIRRTWEAIREDELGIQRLPKIVITQESMFFNKNISTIEILKGFRIDLNPDQFIFVAEFNNFPSWALPFTHVNYVFYSTDMHSFDPNNTNFINQTEGFHIWKQPDNNIDNYELFVETFGSLQAKVISGAGFSFQSVPTFLDLSVTLYNQRIFDEIQHNKT